MGFGAGVLVDQQSILEQLKKIEGSKTFHAVRRDRELLRFLVEKRLAGLEGQISERAIALDFAKAKYGDATALNKARALASRLRSRLPVYYDREGAEDRIRISIPNGAYVPEFRFLGNPSVIKVIDKAPTIQRGDDRLIDKNLIADLLKDVLSQLLNERLAPPTPYNAPLSGDRALLRHVRESASSGDLSAFLTCVEHLAVEELLEAELREVITLLDLITEEEQHKAHVGRRKLLKVQFLLQCTNINRDDLYLRHLLSISLVSAAALHMNASNWPELLECSEAFLAHYQTWSASLSWAKELFDFVRLLSLFHTQAFDALAAEYADEQFVESYLGIQYWMRLGLEVNLFARLRDHDRTERIFGKWKRVLAFQERQPELTKVIISAAGLLSEAQFYQLAIRLLDLLLYRFRKGYEEAIDVIRHYAIAWKAQIRFLTIMERHEDAVHIYEADKHLFSELADPDIVIELAWAGTETTRAFRSQGRHADADVLARSLEEQFGKCDDAEIQSAVAWALVEISKGAVASGSFVEAANCCSIVIERWGSHCGTKQLRRPVAWAHAQLVHARLKMSEPLDAAAAYEAMKTEFGEDEDPDIQLELAWTLLEMTIALRKDRRFSRSIALADQVIARFESSPDTRIAAEVTAAIHAKGDALLCQAKALFINELEEDAKALLDKACELFRESLRREPSRAKYLGCLAYGYFLSGHIEEARECYTKAYKLGAGKWPDWNEWFELKVLPLGQDAEFLARTGTWIEVVDESD